MIEIVLNGEKKQLKSQQSLQALLTDIGFASSYAAVAVNKSIIDYSAYDTTQIKQGDEIDILTPMQGG
ncbi:sulfur carrier protein ThiS [Cysteiniphilum halobium]|uniref:sulfur carrier protein ThiS n=1 Tax=Cysteiniphilum halobium TaxID=2219059 RepID=UPI003F837E38